MPQIELSQLPLIHRPCALNPMKHPTDCDRESCGLYAVAMELVETLSYATHLPQAVIMEMLGNPRDPVLYEAWIQAIRDHIGDDATLCKFGRPLNPQENLPALPEPDA